MITIDENLFFLPAATSMIYEMGLESQLVGVTNATRINQK
jgi:ABC-type hemin transport system substrate-binding protein